VVILLGQGFLNVPPGVDLERQKSTPVFRVQAGGEASVQCGKGAILHFFQTMLGRYMRKRCADVGFFTKARTDDHSFSHVRLMPAMNPLASPGVSVLLALNSFKIWRPQSGVDNMHNDDRREPANL
jgi:hypothetical protein